MTGWFLAGLLLAGAGLALGFFVAQRPSDAVLALELRRAQAMNQLLQTDYEAQLLSLRSRVAQAENELLIERASRTELEKTLTQTQSDLGDTQDQLAFFEQLLPPGPAGAIGLRSIDLDRLDGALSYRVLLMRSGKPRGQFLGVLQFVATGTQNGVAGVSTVLKSLRVDAQGKALLPSEQKAIAAEDALEPEMSLEFEQFQRNEGLLALPEGFEPKYVTIRVLKGSIVLASRRVDL